MPSLSWPPKAVLVIALGSIVVSIVAAPDMAWAQSDSEPQRVAMAADLRVFGPVGNPSDDSDLLHAAMRSAAKHRWQATDASILVVDDEVLHQSVTSNSLYEGTLDLAREWAQMGIESYKQVRTREAVDYLERSLENYESISHDIVAPREVSEILMYLALSYLEEGTNVVRPLEVFQEMIRRDPSRQMEAGYYPDFIVQYFENAQQSLWRELRQEGPPTEESQRIADLVDADYVYHGYVVPTSNDDIELVAYLYDRRNQELLPAERLRLASIDETSLAEGFDRLASRLSVCLVEAVPDEEIGGASPIASSRGTGRLSIYLGMLYGSFLQVPAPIQTPFGNYGMSVGAGWSVTREFQLVGTVQVSNSMREYSGALRENFATVRATAGGELGRDFGPIYLGLATSLEVTRIAPVRVFTDRSCIPDPELLCPGETGTRTFDEHGLHWGIQLRPRISWALADSFQISSTLGVGYYFSPLDDRLLNFPVTTELGIQYRF